MIVYTKQTILLDGLSEVVQYSAPVGYFLFVEARCFFGVLPPYTMIRKILRKGSLISVDGKSLKWKPFIFRRIDYEKLEQSIVDHPDWGGSIDSEFSGSSEYWRRWAMLRWLKKFRSTNTILHSYRTRLN